MKRGDVQAALDAARSAIALATAFDFQAASDQLKEGLQFARETGNATAFVRAGELLAKLHGHLSDRLDVRSNASVEFIFPSFGGGPERMHEQAAKTLDGSVVDGVATVALPQKGEHDGAD
jgi:hypothetical protein